MKKYFILIFIFFICNEYSKAQKFDLSYGLVLGVNTSFLDSKNEIDYSQFNDLDRNISISSSVKLVGGYNVGAFVKLNPNNLKISFESGLLISNLNYDYSLGITYERYYATPWNSEVDNWIPESEWRGLNDEFKLISIPVIIGYSPFTNGNIEFRTGIIVNYLTNNPKLITLEFGEKKIFEDFFFSYQAGVNIPFKEKFVCKFYYERSLDILKAQSRIVFPWEMLVDKLNINIISLGIAYRLSKN